MRCISAILVTYPVLWIPGWVRWAEASRGWSGSPSVWCVADLWTAHFHVLQSTCHPEKNRLTLLIWFHVLGLWLTPSLVFMNFTWWRHKLIMWTTFFFTDLDWDVHGVYHQCAVFRCGPSLSTGRAVHDVRDLKDPDDCQLVERRGAAVQNHPCSCGTAVL